MVVNASHQFFAASNLPLTVVRTANGDIKRHSHGFLELVLVINGRAQHHHYQPQSDVANCYEIRANDLFLIPLEWSHAYKQTDNFFIYNILFERYFLDEVLHQTESPSRSLQLLAGATANSIDELTHKIHLRTGERELLEACLREVSREITLRRSGFELVARSKMTEALVLVARIAEARANGSAATAIIETGSPVAIAAAFMEERFSESISLEAIASAAHLNPNYLCEVFKATFGTSVGAYLSQLRLEHARFLLTTTQIPVTEVADQAGFVDAGYFARVFKTSTGQTPREFRATSSAFSNPQLT